MSPPPGHHGRGAKPATSNNNKPNRPCIIVASAGTGGFAESAKIEELRSTLATYQTIASEETEEKERHLCTIEAQREELKAKERIAAEQRAELEARVELFRIQQLEREKEEREKIALKDLEIAERDRRIQEAQDRALALECSLAELKKARKLKAAPPEPPVTEDIPKSHLPFQVKAPPAAAPPPPKGTYTERGGWKIPSASPAPEPFCPKAGWVAGKQDVAEQKKIEESIRAQAAKEPKAPPPGYPFGAGKIVPNPPPKPRRPPPRLDGAPPLSKLDRVSEDPEKQPPPVRNLSPPEGCQFKVPPPSALPPPTRNRRPLYFGKRGATRAERDTFHSDIWCWYELCPAEDRQFIAPEVVEILLQGKKVREAYFAEPEKKTVQDKIYIPRPLSYKCKVRVGFEVHGTIDDLDSTQAVKDNPLKGPGYLPPSAWHYLQYVANAGFQIVLIVRAPKNP